MKYKNCCRTCLDGSKDLRHINSVITIAGSEIHLTDILKNFYNYEVNKHSFTVNHPLICICLVY